MCLYTNDEGVRELDSILTVQTWRSIGSGMKLSVKRMLTGACVLLVAVLAVGAVFFAVNGHLGFRSIGDEKEQSRRLQVLVNEDRVVGRTLGEVQDEVGLSDEQVVVQSNGMALIGLPYWDSGLVIDHVLFQFTIENGVISDVSYEIEG